MQGLPTEQDAIMLMFGEERRAKIPRTLNERFEHGFQLGEAKMVPQERFEGELG